ncbi:hypothetical protein N9019_03165, partial [Akkermansiaceae bacterium]|nr:hypothetical protein [Akkermansiaceae bacterium]
ENAEDYVHRIGRTGRAEKEGDAFTLLTADELEFADSVEAFINKKIERKKLEGFEYQYTALLDTEKRKPIKKPRRGGGETSAPLNHVLGAERQQLNRAHPWNRPRCPEYRLCLT